MKKLVTNILTFSCCFLCFYFCVNIFIAASTSFSPAVENKLLKYAKVTKTTEQKIYDLEQWLQKDSAKETGIILGSSTAYMNINPQVITDETGVDFFNCGTSSQTITHSAVILKYILDKHKPDYLLLDVYPGMWDTEITETPMEWAVNHPHPYHIFIFRLVAGEKSVGLWNHYLYSLIKRCLPFANYKNTNSLAEYMGKGHVCLNETLAMKNDITRIYTSMSASNKEALEEIQGICNSNDIELFILLPKPLNAEVNKEVLKKVSAVIIDAEEFVDRSYYRDYDHMHCDGAARFSHWLSAELKTYMEQE